MRLSTILIVGISAVGQVSAGCNSAETGSDRATVTSVTDPLPVGTDSGPSSLETSGESESPVGLEWLQIVGLDTAELDRRQYAERERRIDFCMSEKGYAYEPVTWNADADRSYARASNPLNEASAKKYGYFVPRFDNVANLNPSTDTGFNDALHGRDGDKTSGCAFSSMQEYRQENDQYFDLANELINSLLLSIDGFSASQETEQIRKDWSACMKAKGYSFGNQEDASASFEADPIRPSVVEVQTRLADYECDVLVGLTATRSSWERQRVDQWLDRASSDLVELQRRAEALSDVLSALEAEKLE